MKSTTLKELRIDEQTVILVPIEKATESYRQEYMRRLKKAKSKAMLGHSIPQIDKKPKK